MPGSHLFNLGLFQKKFGGNNKIAGVSINLGLGIIPVVYIV